MEFPNFFGIFTDFALILAIYADSGVVVLGALDCVAFPMTAKQLHCLAAGRSCNGRAIVVSHTDVLSCVTEAFSDC